MAADEWVAVEIAVEKVVVGVVMAVEVYSIR